MLYLEIDGQDVPFAGNTLHPKNIKPTITRMTEVRFQLMIQVTCNLQKVDADVANTIYPLDTLSQGPQSSSQSSQNGDSVISDEEEQLVDDEDVTWNMAEDEDLAMESGRGPTSEQSWDYDRRGDRRGALHSAGSFDLSQGNTTSGYESDALDSIEQQAVGLDDTLDAGVNDLVDYVPVTYS